MDTAVSFVYDGDTIQTSNGTKVRLIGIDAPEVDSEECFATQSAQALKAILSHQEVKLESDEEKFDKYNRLLGYVWVGNVFINEYMVRQGYAKATPIKPNTKYAALFYDAQKDAQENKRGLWKECIH